MDCTNNSSIVFLCEFNTRKVTLFLEELTTSPLKEINVQTRPGDYLLSIEEIVGGVMCKDSAKNYEATQGQFFMANISIIELFCIKYDIERP